MGQASPALEAGADEPFIPAPGRFVETAKRRGSKPAYYVREDKGWVPTPWNAYAAEVRQAARALIALGVQPGDVVCIFGGNKPEWVMMDLAAMMIGASPAGIYFTASPQDAAYIINHSQAGIVLAEKQEHFESIAKERAGLNCLKHVVMMKGAAVSDPLQMTWEDFLSKGEPRFEAEVEQRLRALQPGDIGTLIYTSGTTGPPKAVQLSHGALVASTRLMPSLWKVTEEHRVISYLPLAHIAEKMFTIHFQARVGNAVYFARSMLELPQHLAEVRPNIFFAVPRVFEKMAAAAQIKIAATPGTKGKIARWAVEVGKEWHRREQVGLGRGLGLRLRKAVASALVHKKAKRAMGLDRAHFIVCGAAPVPEETLRFMSGLDIPIREAWGMSETTAAGTANMPGATRIGSVGRPHPGLELKLAEDGEILVRGPSLFSGYARDPEATGRAIVNGWLHTGDIGRIDSDGFVYITGRKKDIIITSGGKNIAPANIEMELASLPLIENAIVVGDRRPYLSALITLSSGAVAQFASERGLIEGDPRLRNAVRTEMQRGIDAINERHSRVEQIRRFHILQEPLSIEAGDLTATMKVKRSAVLTRNASAVDALYSEEYAQ